jgi:superfamily II DNA/RNA helicase
MSSPFADLGVSTAVVSALDARGIRTPFPVQRLVIGDVLAGRDVLVKSPTGSGKTLAFGVPMVDVLEADGPRPQALILAPTRELAGQIVDELRSVCHARALNITAVYGGVSMERQRRAVKKAHVLVATPGRLEDLMQQRALRLDKVKLLVLDEADRMLDMGFRPAVDRIVNATPHKRQTLFFSATLDGEVGRIADQYTRDAHSHEHAHTEQQRGDVEHRFVAVQHEAKLDHLVSELRDRERDLALVFVRTKRGADRLVKRLKAQDVHAVAMHGDKTQSQREKALARFERGDVTTLVATDVAARGLDVEGITHVINFDAPGDHEDYVHRIGRTARAGATGVGITFVLHDQAADVGKIARTLKLDSEFQRSGLAHGSGGNGSRSPGSRSYGGRPGGGRSNGSHSNRGRSSGGRPDGHRRRGSRAR